GVRPVPRRTPSASEGVATQHPGTKRPCGRGTDAASEFHYDVSTMLEVLNVTFFVLHTTLILFNMVGWAWRRTRVFHLITFRAAPVSWFGLGGFYRWGGLR